MRILLVPFLFACGSAEAERPTNPVTQPAPDVSAALSCPSRTHHASAEGLPSLDAEATPQRTQVVVRLTPTAAGRAERLGPKPEREAPDRFVEFVIPKPGVEAEPSPDVASPEGAPAMPGLVALFAEEVDRMARLGARSDIDFDVRGQALFLVTSDVSGARLVHALHTAHAGRFPEVSLAARAGGAPPVDWLDASFAAAARGGRWAWSGGCPDAVARIGVLASNPDLGPMLLASDPALSGVLQPCPRADQLEFFTAVQWLTCETDPLVTWTVQLDPEGERVAVPAEATWGELVQHWRDLEGKRVWPVVEEPTTP